MKLTVKLLRPFSKVIGKNELKLDINVRTVEDLLEILANKYPKIKNDLFKENNELTDFINLFVNDKPISALEGIKTKLKNNDEILLFTPVSGG